ncbi:galanin receptor 2b-like [Saccoglossus kowalevskii]
MWTSNATSIPTTDVMPDPAIYILLHVVYGILGGLGVLGNLLVLFVFIRVRSLQTLTNSLILHQSVIDLLSAFCFLSLKFGPTLLLPYGLQGDLLCRFWASEFILWWFFVASTFNLVAMTMERYFAVVRPLLYRDHFTFNKAKVIVACIWVASLAFELHWLLVNKATGGFCYPLWPNENVQKMFGVFVFLVLYFAPISVMFFSYTRILMKMKANALQQSTSTQRAKKNVTKTLCFVSITYAVCWCVNQILYLRYNLGGATDFNGPMFNTAVVLVFCNMCVNPFIYTLHYTKFRKGLKTAFFCHQSNNRVTPFSSST